MIQNTYREIAALSVQPQAWEDTLQYLSAHLRPIVREGDRVLLCFPVQTEGSLCALYEQAVLRCGGTPVLWGPDRKWKTMLQQAFFSRAAVLIGPPLVLLGLSKLKRQNGTPLSVRRVVTAGYPCLDWMIDGIIKHLDCYTWGSFGLGTTGAVAGFSCSKSRGVHLRSREYVVDILGNDGESVPHGTEGEMVLYAERHPELRFYLGEVGRIETAPCPCGCREPRLMDIRPGNRAEADMVDLREYLHSWTSVLDCQVKRGECGLELEMVVFPGEKLPVLPTVAKRTIRAFDPNQDEPFFYEPAAKNVYFSFESH